MLVLGVFFLSKLRVVELDDRLDVAAGPLFFAFFGGCILVFSESSFNLPSNVSNRSKLQWGKVFVFSFVPMVVRNVPLLCYNAGKELDVTHSRNSKKKNAKKVCTYNVAQVNPRQTRGCF